MFISKFNYILSALILGFIIHSFSNPLEINNLVKIIGGITSIALLVSENYKFNKFILLYMLFQSFNPEASSFYRLNSSFSLGLFGIHVYINVIYLIITIGFSNFLWNGDILNRSIRGKVYTENGGLAFGTEMNFKLTKLKGKLFEGITSGNDIDTIQFEKSKSNNSKIKLAKVQFNNDKSTSSVINYEFE